MYGESTVVPVDVVQGIVQQLSTVSQHTTTATTAMRHLVAKITGLREMAGTEHLLKIPEGSVREILGGSDRGYDLPEGTPNELEMRINWANIGNGEVVEEVALNVIFTVPYPYVMADEVEARPQLKNETLEATDVVGFGYESDGRDSEAKEFGARSEAGSLEWSVEGYRPAKTR